MRWLLVVPILLASAPASADTVYLLIKSAKGPGYTGGLALHSLPMKTIEQCEETGALIVSSARFKTHSAKYDAFECVAGK